MSIPRYHTVGAVAQDLQALKALDERLEDLGVPADSILGLSRMQWFELASTYLGVTAVSVLMGAVHPPTGIAVQAVMTLVVIIGLILYHRKPHFQMKLLAMGLPEKLAEEWEGAFHEGFALALATVP